MRYCTYQMMLCFRNHNSTVSLSLECTNEASEVWSGILETILLILMKVHACVCTYALLHYWKKPSAMKKAFHHWKSHPFHQGSIPVCGEVAANVCTFHRHVLNGTQSAGYHPSYWSFTKLLIYFIWGLGVHLHISVDRRSNIAGMESHHVRQGGSSPKEGWKGEGNISAE